MKSVLVLGAGHSAPFLIDAMLRLAETSDLEVTVADLDGEAAARRVGEHPKGRGIALDFLDASARRGVLEATDVVVNLLPPPFQPLVAKACVEARAHMVSASYTSPEVHALAGAARDAGITLLTELGLDPGIDLMSAQKIIDEIHADDGIVEAFASYGGGLPEPDHEINPFRYCVTWNPRNVVMAGESGARMLHEDRIRLIPRHRLFTSVWPMEIPDVGTLEAYANRDALAYRDIHGLPAVQTLVRATFRYPGFCAAWNTLVRLGIADETFEVPRLAESTFSELAAMFLPGPPRPTDTLRQGVAELLGLAIDDPSLERLDWLGVFSDERTGAVGNRPADALVALVERRLPLPPGRRDLVVLHHDFVVRSAKTNERQRIVSTLIRLGDPRGEPGSFTAMARCVGLPLALGARLLLEGRVTTSGLLGPTREEVFQPILKELEREGLAFRESRRPFDEREPIVPFR